MLTPKMTFDSLGYLDFHINLLTMLFTMRCGAACLSCQGVNLLLHLKLLLLSAGSRLVDSRQHCLMAVYVAGLD